MRENIYFYCMHTHILFILSFVLLVAAAHVGAAHTCIDKERQALLDFKAPLQDPRNMLSTWRPEEEDDCCQWLGTTLSMEPFLENLETSPILEVLDLDSLGSCRVENLDWLSSLSSLEELYMDGTSLAKANKLSNFNYHGLHQEPPYL
ncbi:leucine-rich repeat-containing protein [Tanacetum coccineum]